MLPEAMPASLLQGGGQPSDSEIALCLQDAKRQIAEAALAGGDVGGSSRLTLQDLARLFGTLVPMSMGRGQAASESGNEDVL